MPRHYVLIHGGWHGGWAWRGVVPLLREAGHAVSAPTLSGLGERAHIAPGACGLAVHVQDIVAHLAMEDLREVVLVGHSYSGCVVSGVLAGGTGRIAHAFYLDAFVPMQGQALVSFVEPAAKSGYEKLAAQGGLVPPPPVESWGERWGIVDPALRDWVRARITPQAALSYTEAVQGDPMREGIPCTYASCARNPNPLFKSIARGMRENRLFTHVEVDGHHDVMLIDPPRLAARLLALE